jgi:D-serine deaminase-like pyridoxal phosphate-dependent protein
MSNDRNWYTVENVGEFDSPALLLYPDRIQINIRRLLASVPADRLRPHVKTNKTMEVCQMMLNAGIYKFKSATIAEAEMLAMIQARDVLLAYPPTPVKIKRLIRLIKKYPATKFSCLVDHVTSAENLSSECSNEGLKISVYIDLNPGMNRTGIVPSDALNLYQQIHALPSLEIEGLHVYDGHLKDRDIHIRKEKCLQAFAPVLVLKNEIERISGRRMILIAGGSPTCFIHAEAGDRECSPGTFIFWDKGYSEQLAEQPFEWAALLMSRVISIPAPDLICVDLGNKSVASESPQPRVFFLNAPNATPTTHSEEHLVLKVPDSSLHYPGQVLYGVPWHICPSVSLYDKAWIVESNQIVGSWKVIARNREISL